MTIPSQHYAELSDLSYKAPETKKDADGKVHFVSVKIDGVSYLPLVHSSNEASGYQGTIYKRQDTGEIVVAHRGTEGDKMLVDASMWNNPGTLDIATDAAMVFGRVNPQLDDAIQLTEQALQIAKDLGKEGEPIPEVTVTGHSLGGALTQITAHKFGLRGETFNSYGVASLGYDVPEGGHTVINHVMASDVVSAASPHFGQVKVYATEKEIENIKNGAYTNESRWWNEDVLSAAASGIGSHSMHYFTRRDGDGKPDKSVLEDPQAQVLAAQYSPMIDNYRHDIEVARSAATGIGDAIVFAAQQRAEQAREQAQANEYLVRGVRHVSGHVGDALKDGLTAIGQREIDRADQQAEAYRQVGNVLMNGIRHAGDGIKAGLDHGKNAIERIGDFVGDRMDDAFERNQQLPDRNESPQLRGQSKTPDYRDGEHPDHAMFQHLRQRLPAIVSDDKAAELTLACRRARIFEPERITSVEMNEGKVVVNGAYRWEVAFGDLNSTAPPMAETMRQAGTFEQQQLAQLATIQEQNHQARGLS